MYIKRSTATVAALVMASAVFFSSCDVPPATRAQDQIYRVARFTSEAQAIIQIASDSSGAEVTVVGIYDSDYTYRVIVANIGEAPAQGSGQVPVSTAGHQEILSRLKDGQAFFLATADLPPGPLKSELKVAKRNYIAAAPIYDADGYLIGYVGFSWEADPQSEDDTILVQATAASAELTRLARIFQ